jgi:hypothetical protein
MSAWWTVPLRRAVSQARVAHEMCDDPLPRTGRIARAGSVLFSSTRSRHPARLPAPDPVLPGTAIIQAAFGWEDYHMWAFEPPQDRFGAAIGSWGSAARRPGTLTRSPRTSAPRATAPDFGDDWEHDILVEAVTDAEAGIASPSWPHQPPGLPTRGQRGMRG